MSATNHGIIERGTRVRLRTTNGGDAVWTLHERYVPTYAATFEELPRPVLAERILSIEEV